MTIILPTSCSDSDEDKNIDYLKGDKALVEKGLIGTWKTVQYDLLSGKPYDLYQKYDGTQRWTKFDLPSNPWEYPTVYNIYFVDGEYKIFLNTQGGGG